VVVSCILYDAAGHDQACELRKIDVSKLTSDQLLWVDVVGYSSSDLRDLPEPLKGAVNSGPEQALLQTYDDFYRFSLPLFEQPNKFLTFIVGKSWVLTLAEKREAYFDEFVESDRGETLKGRLSPTAFLAALLMRHYDAFRDLLLNIDRSIDKLDDSILRSKERRPPLHILAGLRKKVADLRATLSDQRGIVRSLATPDFLAQVDDNDRDFLLEVNRAFEKAEDDVVRARETVLGSFDLYATRVAQDTNSLLKALTIITVITGLVGAVAGIFGMNFDTPIPHSGLLGFMLVNAAMFFAAAVIIAIALWRRWF
jgi:Mg2+ and Co2+ transporter CorA